MSKKADKKSALKTSIKEKLEEKLEDKLNPEKDSQEDFDDTHKAQIPNSKENILDLDAYDFYQKYDPSKNKYDPWLTLYERTSILGVRSTQLENNAQPLIDVPEGIEDVREIAELELAAGKLPLIICREDKEYWRVADLADPRS